MKISLNAVKRLLNTKLQVDDTQLIDLISTRVANVEDVFSLKDKYQGIVIAKIVGAKLHPDSDKLGIYQVDIGTAKIAKARSDIVQVDTDKIDKGKAATIQIVAGDRSLQVGDYVALITVGSKVPYNSHPEKFDGVIREVKLGGELSQGMFASARELDFSNENTRVLVISKNGKVEGINGKIVDLFPGQPILEVFDLDDKIIDIENKAFTNRPECFGIIGVAREIAAVTGNTFTTPDWFNYGYKYADNNIDISNKGSNEFLEVQNEAGVNCPRYVGAVMGDVTVTESPLWLQIQLSLHGLRPINNIVDMTNYLMIMTGQPLHAFDYDKVVGVKEIKTQIDNKNANGNYGENNKSIINRNNIAKILVRMAKDGEKIITLDGKEVELDKDTVVITDGVKPIAIAGIMGGQQSEIDNDTKRIIIESASFEMYNIRKSVNRLGINTDASNRYSKNQDPHQCDVVINKAIEMVELLAGGALKGEIVDVFTHLRKYKQITISASKLSQIIGIQLSVKEIIEILNRVNIIAQCENDKINSDKVAINIPSYRQDLNIAEDIYEEVGRIYGFINIKLTLPIRTIASIDHDKIIVTNKRIRESLAKLGCNEILTYNFVSVDSLNTIGIDLENVYHFKNALSVDLAYMRPAMSFCIIDKVAFNLEQGFDNFALFEINKTHIRGQLNNENLPVENRVLALSIGIQEKTYNKNFNGSGYFLAKEYLTKLLEELKINNIEYIKLAEENLKQIQDEYIKQKIEITAKQFDPQQSALIICRLGKDTIYLGVIGVYNDALIDKYKIAKQSAGFEIDIAQLEKIIGTERRFTMPNKYPKVIQDLCFVCENQLKYAELNKKIIDTVAKSPKDIIINTEPVDIYSEGGEKKQVTIRVFLQSKSKVLYQKDIDFYRTKIISSVEHTLPAKLKE